jgi:hypothetical protein
MSIHRVCAWCGSYEGEIAGARSEITHCICATCVDEKRYCDAPVLKARGRRATRVTRRHEAQGLSGLESDTARPTNRRVT